MPWLCLQRLYEDLICCVVIAVLEDFLVSVKFNTNVTKTRMHVKECSPSKAEGSECPAESPASRHVGHLITASWHLNNKET